MRFSVNIFTVVTVLALGHLSSAEWSGKQEEEKKFCRSLCAEKCGCQAFDCGDECICGCQEKKDDRYVKCIEVGRSDPRLQGMKYDIVVQGPHGHNRVIRQAGGTLPLFSNFFGGIQSHAAPSETVASPNENVASPQDESVAAPAPETVASPFEHVALPSFEENVAAPNLLGGDLFKGGLLGSAAATVQTPAAGKEFRAPAAFPGLGLLDDKLGLLGGGNLPAPAPVAPVIPSFKALNLRGLSTTGGLGGLGGNLGNANALGGLGGLGGLAALKTSLLSK